MRIGFQRNHLFLIILAIIMVGTSYIIYRNQTIEYVVAQSEKAVFFVSTFKDGEPYKTGTGFFTELEPLSTEKIFGVTNLHVVKGADSIVITTNNGKSFQVNQASFWSGNSDLFLFEWNKEDIELNSLNYFERNLDAIEKGQFVFSISHPRGLDYSFSSGAISSLRETETLGEIIQTTTPISAGSSGSPLLTRYGSLIGVNTLSVEEGQNLNFAINLTDTTLSKLFDGSDREFSRVLFDINHSVRIGNQVWMDVNLNVTHFRNGDEIPQAKTAAEWEQAGKERKPVWAYPCDWGTIGFNQLIKVEDCNTIWDSEFGVIYNGYAILDKRGLAPEGWEIPSKDAWRQLLLCLGYEGNMSFENMTNNEGFVNKLKSQLFWENEGLEFDKPGFSALPTSGYFYSDGRTWQGEQLVQYWSKTIIPLDEIPTKLLKSKYPNLFYCFVIANEYIQFPSLNFLESGNLVRCIRKE